LPFPGLNNTFCSEDSQLLSSLLTPRSCLITVIRTWPHRILQSRFSGGYPNQRPFSLFLRLFFWLNYTTPLLLGGTPLRLSSVHSVLLSLWFMFDRHLSFNTLTLESFVPPRWRCPRLPCIFPFRPMLRTPSPFFSAGFLLGCNWSKYGSYQQGLWICLPKTRQPLPPSSPSLFSEYIGVRPPPPRSAVHVPFSSTYRGSLVARSH